MYSYHRVRNYVDLSAPLVSEGDAHVATANITRVYKIIRLRWSEKAKSELS
jgi:hypothetical protein